MKKKTSKNRVQTEGVIFAAAIEDKVSLYPSDAQVKFDQVRSLIFYVAERHELGPVEETLKWGQPSYLCKSGSTIRVDWQPEVPNSIAVFFNCNTVLVETFKEVFPEAFDYTGKRVIMLPLDLPLPQELETCVLMALNYHKLKKLPLLGA